LLYLTINSSLGQSDQDRDLERRTLSPADITRWDPEGVPAVDTIEALTAAAQAFGAQRLELQMDPDAEAAVRESLQRTGLVLLGEIHGVAQTPVLMEEMIAWFGLGGIALEWHHDFGPWLDRWVALGVLSDPRSGSALAGEVWGGDGRLTAGHLAALRRWADSGLLITLMDGTRVVYPRRGESAEELERRSWTERDAAMAGRVLAAPDAVGGRLVVAGNLHTKLKPLPVGVPMGAHLTRQRPGLRSIDFVYGPGRFYNLGPRSLGDRLPGQHVDAPRLIQQQGALLLLVPSPREATVPHRELPGLQRT
jgi:hypothetical protein